MQKRTKKVLISCFFRITLASSLLVFSYYQMDGFSEDYLYVKEPFLEKELVHEGAELPSYVTEVLEQPFFYLGSGRQCFAFLSQDKKVVLKFINQAKFSLPTFLEKIPLAYLQKKQKIRKRRSRSFYESFSLGIENLKEETAFIFARVKNNSLVQKGALPSVLLYDPIGYPKRVDLNKTHFILQKKGDLMCSHLYSLQDSPEKFWDAIDAYLNLVCIRVEKGIYDDDLNIGQNIGYSLGKPFFLDFGRLYKVEKNSFTEKKEELRRATKFLKSWFSSHFPEKLPLLQKRQKEIESHLTP